MLNFKNISVLAKRNVSIKLQTKLVKDSQSFLFFKLFWNIPLNSSYGLSYFLPVPSNTLHFSWKYLLPVLRGGSNLTLHLICCLSRSGFLLSNEAFLEFIVFLTEDFQINAISQWRFFSFDPNPGKNLKAAVVVCAAEKFVEKSRVSFNGCRVLLVGVFSLVVDGAGFF